MVRKSPVKHRRNSFKKRDGTKVRQTTVNPHNNFRNVRILNGKRIIKNEEELIDNLHEIFLQKNYRVL